MKAFVASIQHRQEDILCSFIVGACMQVFPKKPANLDVDNVRVAKLVEGDLHNPTVVRGMVLKGDVVGSIKRVEKAVMVVFASGVDTSAIETKGILLIHFAEQLENYAKTEEAKVEEIGGSWVTVVRSEGGGNRVATEVLRGSNDSILDDLKKVVDDRVTTCKPMCRDSHIVPGAANTEIELARRLDQYAIVKFFKSFERVPRTLAKNAGLNPMDIIFKLYEKYASGDTKVGIDLEKGDFKKGVCKDVSTKNILDLHVTKFFCYHDKTSKQRSAAEMDVSPV